MTDKFTGKIAVVTARYVIGKRGIIRAADVSADYTIRPEPSDNLNALQALKE